MDLKYFQTGIEVFEMVRNPDLDYSSEEIQYHLLDYYDKLHRSFLCDDTWFVKYSLDSWYLKWL